MINDMKNAPKNLNQEEFNEIMNHWWVTFPTLMQEWLGGAILDTRGHKNED